MNSLGFPGGASGREPTLPMQEVQMAWVQSLGWEDPLEEGMATTLVFSPEESHGQRSLVGYGPQGRTELNMTEVT